MTEYRRHATGLAKRQAVVVREAIARVGVVLEAPAHAVAVARAQADESGLPNTVYAVADDQGTFWFHASHCYWGEMRTARTLHVAALVTVLPTRYFVR